jgi:Protein of unknown function (DUF2975)
MRALGHVVSFLAFIVTLSWYFVAIGLIVTACLVAASPFVGLPGMRLTIPVSFSVDPGIVRMTPLSPAAHQGNDENIRIGSGGFAFEIGGERSPRREPQVHVRGSLRFPTQSRSLFAGAAILMAALLSLVFWVLARLRAVFRSLRAGKPFEPANATRIRQIAFAVIVGEVGRAAVVFLANLYASTHFAAEGLHFDARPDFNILAIVYGLIILVIAEIFRAGAQLDEDQSLTV